MKCDQGFPANTLIVGDLNIKPAAVKKIYNVGESSGTVLSSEEGWCHAVHGGASRSGPTTSTKTPSATVITTRSCSTSDTDRH